MIEDFWNVFFMILRISTSTIRLIFEVTYLSVSYKRVSVDVENFLEYVPTAIILIILKISFSVDDKTDKMA